MANTVIALKKSATPAAVPVSLANGEIAINFADGILYYKAANGTIASISGAGYNFGTVNANGTLLVSDTTGDVLAILPGNNITIVGDAINDRLIINADLTAANSWANTKLSNGTVTLAGSLTTTGTVTANAYIYVTPAGGEEGGEIQLQSTGANTSWSIDSYQNNYRVFARTGSTVSNVNFFHAQVGGSVRMGVNRTDPGYTLDVSGIVNASAIYVNGSPISTGSMDYAYVNTSTTAANNYAGAMANSANAVATATFGTITNTTAAFAFANGVATNTTAAFGHSNLTYNAVNSAFGVANAAYARGNTSAQLAYFRVTANGTNLDAASNADTLTISSSNNIVLIANATNDSIQITQPPSGVTATTYGGSSQLPVFTVDTYGRITSASNLAFSSGGASVAVSDSAPGSPTANSLWWNSNIGRMFIYYNDGTSSQWVDSSPAQSISPAFDVANASFGKANTLVATVAGTSGRVTSSGTTAITLDLATAGAGAASYSSGISAITIDAYGRVTSVTGSAGYITSAGNAATVGGFTPSQTNGVANRVVVADASGYVNNNYFNSTDDVSTSNMTYIMGKFGDNYYRSATAAKAGTFFANNVAQVVPAWRSAGVVAFGPTISDFFGATSSISLAAGANYIIEVFCHFTKTTAGTVTWTPTFSSAPTIYYGEMWTSPITGLTSAVVTPAQFIYQTGVASTGVAFTATGSLTTGVNHLHRFRFLVNTNLATNFRMKATQSAGTMTPLSGSFYTAEPITGSFGTFVA